MKQLVYTASFISLITLSSCAEKKAETQQPELTPPSLTLDSSAPATLPANTVTLPANNNAAGAATPKINPAHGQPGHRCDVEVGAAIPTSLPAQTPATTPITAPVTRPAVAAPVINSPSVGALNPEHGQPGHRCDIAVGQPLNSSPIK